MAAFHLIIYGRFWVITEVVIGISHGLSRVRWSGWAWNHQ